MKPRDARRRPSGVSVPFTRASITYIARQFEHATHQRGNAWPTVRGALRRGENPARRDVAAVLRDYLRRAEAHEAELQETAADDEARIALILRAPRLDRAIVAHLLDAYVAGPSKHKWTTPPPNWQNDRAVVLFYHRTLKELRAPSTRLPPTATGRRSKALVTECENRTAERFDIDPRQVRRIVKRHPITPL